MPAQVIIPRLGWAMEEGVFVGWLKRDGDTIREGDPIFSLEGEKAVEEVESLDAGILRIPPDAPKAGDKVLVGALIGYVVEPGEQAPFATESPSPLMGEGRGEGEKSPSGTPNPSPPTPLPQGARGANGSTSHRHNISPRARKMAQQLGVDWTQLRGSGRTGRIRESDILAASRVKPSAPQVPPPRVPSEPRPSVSSTPISAPQPTTLEPQVLSAASANVAPASSADGKKSQITPLRRTIAERMLHSQRNTAPVTLNTTINVSTLVQLRKQLRSACTADEVPSITDLLVRLTAEALSAQPSLNSRWDGDEIIVHPEIHIGVAIDTEAGLLVPVLRNAHELKLREITAQLRDLAARAKRRELKAEELRGGTFTITNLGSFGIDSFTPIINYPECAVLGVGRIVRQPVVASKSGEEDKIAVQDRLTLSLTFDHRIIDGAPAARFLQHLSDYLENPLPRLIS